MRLRLSLLCGMFVFLAACASEPQQPPQIQRISPEELERIIPKPLPNLGLDEIIKLSKSGVSPEQIIEKIKASNSLYDLNPSQTVELNQQGVSAKVLDYMHASREQALRDGFADEINKREQASKAEQERLRREYELRVQPYYDPFWGYAYPYWGYGPYYGPSFRYYHRR